MYRDAHDRLVAELWTTLGDQDYEAARSAGEGMTVDEVIAYAAAEAGRA
jgi:hypothetical protein